MKKVFNYLWGHKMSVLSALLVAVAVLLGASSGFAMAVVEPVDEATDPNPSENIKPEGENNPGGRPDGEAVKPDEQGNDTQLPGQGNTATNLRDAGILAEDYDEKTVEFRKFRFPEETLFARVCKPVKAKDYVHKHWITGSTDLDATYGGADIEISKTTKEISIAKEDIENWEILKNYSDVVVSDVRGYDKDAEGNEVADGEMVLFVLDNEANGGTKIKFKVINPPIDTHDPYPEISEGTIFQCIL